MGCPDIEDENIELTDELVEDFVSYVHRLIDLVQAKASLHDAVQCAKVQMELHRLMGDAQTLGLAPLAKRIRSVLSSRRHDELGTLLHHHLPLSADTLHLLVAENTLCL